MKHNIKNLDEKMAEIQRVAHAMKSGKIKAAKTYPSIEAFAADRSRNK